MPACATFEDQYFSEIHDFGSEAYTSAWTFLVQYYHV
jgi:hypothetical protein